MAVLTLNRPDERNPLDQTSSAALRDALRAVMDDSAVRSVAITGAGKAFCAGGNLRQMAEFKQVSAEDALEWPRAIVDLHQDMLNAPKPVIAAVNGAAYAGGMGLAGMCDILVATRSARFAMSEVKLGLFPMIIVAHLARSIPRKILLEMMMTGQPLSAEDAYRFGFVNRVCEPDELDEILMHYAELFEQVSPSALRLGRRAFTLLADMPAHQALDAAQFLNLPFFFSDDLEEGTRAFLDKRSPKWIPGGAR